MTDPKIKARRKPGAIIVVFGVILIFTIITVFIGLNTSHEQEQDEQQEMGLTPNSSGDAVRTNP